MDGDIFVHFSAILPLEGRRTLKEGKDMSSPPAADGCDENCERLSMASLRTSGRVKLIISQSLCEIIYLWILVA